MKARCEWDFVEKSLPHAGMETVVLSLQVYWWPKVKKLKCLSYNINCMRKSCWKSNSSKVWFLHKNYPVVNKAHMSKRVMHKRLDTRFYSELIVTSGNFIHPDLWHYRLRYFERDCFNFPAILMLNNKTAMIYSHDVKINHMGGIVLLLSHADANGTLRNTSRVCLSFKPHYNSIT